MSTATATSSPAARRRLRRRCSRSSAAAPASFLWARRLRLRVRPHRRRARSPSRPARGRSTSVGNEQDHRARPVALRLVKYTSAGFLAWQRSYADGAGRRSSRSARASRIYLAGERLDDQTARRRWASPATTTSGERLWSRSVGTPAGHSVTEHGPDAKTIGHLRRGPVQRYEGYERGPRLPHAPRRHHAVRRSIADPNDEGARCVVPGCDMDGIGRVTAGGWSYERFAVWRFGSTGTLLDHLPARHAGRRRCAVARRHDCGASTPPAGLEPVSTARRLSTCGPSAARPRGCRCSPPFSHRSPTEGHDSATRSPSAPAASTRPAISDDDLALIAKYER